MKFIRLTGIENCEPAHRNISVNIADISDVSEVQYWQRGPFTTRVAMHNGKEYHVQETRDEVMRMIFTAM